MAEREGSLESVGGLNRQFWQNRRVFLTGHTGFKGTWLSLWLADMGAKVTGYALLPPTEPNLYDLAGASSCVRSLIADIRDRAVLCEAMREAKPEIVIHMAAQPLVLDSYRNPAETYEVNVMGTVNVLEAVRGCKGIRAVLNVTTDKCYENREWDWGYRENDALGGRDPYSNSKACSELITACYRQAFFSVETFPEHGVSVATARAGNVIGGGDWAAQRLVPDCMRSLLKSEPVPVRNPDSIRPWQHVLDPLCGYLTLAEKMVLGGPDFAESWNFGPAEENSKSVGWMVKKVCKLWGTGAQYEIDTKCGNGHEAGLLRLDCSKTRNRLNWQPVWPISRALEKVVEWTKAYQQGADMRQITMSQIHEYERQAAKQP